MTNGKVHEYGMTKTFNGSAVATQMGKDPTNCQVTH